MKQKESETQRIWFSYVVATGDVGLRIGIRTELCCCFFFFCLVFFSSFTIKLYSNLTRFGNAKWKIAMRWMCLYLWCPLHVRRTIWFWLSRVDGLGLGECAIYFLLIILMSSGVIFGWFMTIPTDVVCVGLMRFEIYIRISFADSHEYIYR